MAAALVAAEIDPAGQRLYVVVSGVDLLPIAARIRNTTPLYKGEHSGTGPDGNQTIGLSTALSWPAIVQLVSEFGPAWTPGPRLAEWTRAQSARAVQLPDVAAVRYRPTWNGFQPFTWQRQAQAMITDQRRVMLFDEAGSGKTLSALLGLEEAGAFPALVFCPASMVDTWVEEATRWLLPGRRIVAYRGTRRKKLGNHDLYVAGFDTGKRDAPDLLQRDLAAFIVDELHLIANPDTERAKASKKIAAKVGVFVGLGGTPITHNVADLHTALMCIEPQAWPSKDRWKERYCIQVRGDYEDLVVGLLPNREPEFRLTLAGRDRRVAKADVLAELPPKLYSTRYVEMPPKHRKAYEEMRDDMLANLPEDAGQLAVMTALAQLTRLNQLASAPARVYQVDTGKLDEDGRPVMETVVDLEHKSWKVDALLEVMAERPGKPVVTFAPSKKLIVLAGEAALEAGYRIGWVVGGQTPSERTSYVKAFQAGELDLLCVTTGAGGVGLTLTASDTAVFLQRPWSFVEASQAEDRLHRPGAEQHAGIQIVDVVTKNSVDARVRAVLRDKAGSLADLLRDRRIAENLFKEV